MPVCKAVYIAKELIKIKNNNKQLLKFFSAIQKKFYALGENPTNLSFYESICEEFDLCFKEFSKLFLETNLDEKLFIEFNEARNLGLGGMPSLILSKNSQTHTICRGYNSFEYIEKKIQEQLRS